MKSYKTKVLPPFSCHVPHSALGCLQTYKQTTAALGSFVVCEDYSLFKGLSFLEFHPFSEIECGTTPRVEHDWKTKIFKRKIFVFVFLVEG